MPAEGRRLVWAPAAKNDLRQIWRYFVGVASPEIADRLLKDIQRACERVRRRPFTWRMRDEIVPGLRSILVHPYVVFYRMTGESKSCGCCISGEIWPRYFGCRSGRRDLSVGLTEPALLKSKGP